jgi:sugar lactone lactonase YvrE
MRVGEQAAVRGAATLAALLSAAAGQYWLVGQFEPTRAAIAWAAAFAVFLALYLVDAPGRALPPASDVPPAAIEWPAAAVVLLVGVVFRVYRLGTFPPGLNHDAAWNALYAASIVHTDVPYTPYVSSAWGRESLILYLQAAAIKLVGVEHLASMLPTVVAMAVMLPFFYWWVRTMFGTRAALVATLFIGATGWTLVYGRIGWGAGLQPCFTVLTCCYFWRGWTTGRLRDFAISGVALALTLNTYNAARAFPLVFPLFALAVLLQQRGVREPLRRYGAGIAVMLGAFVIVVAPLAWYAVNNWIKFMGRAEALYTPEAIGKNLAAAGLLFNYWGNSDDFFLKTPLLEFPVAMFLGFGVLWVLLRLRDARAAFLAIGFAIGILPGLITRPNANHCVGALPFVYLFAGLGVTYFVQQFRRFQKIGDALAIGFAVVVGAGQVYATFTEYLGSHAREIWGYYPETTVLGRYMHTLLGKYAIYVGGANYPRDSLTYLTFKGSGDPFERQYTWIDDVTTLMRQMPEAPPGQGLAVILSNVDAGPPTFARLRERFPDAEVVELKSPPETGTLFARALLVPPGAAPHPLAAPELPAGIHMWTGGAGSEPGRFTNPKGLARSAKGEFYVIDTGNHRIQKFDAKGVLVATIGEFGSTPITFREPATLVFDHDGTLLVVDTWNHRIQHLTPDGQPLNFFAPPKGFFGPRGIAITKDRLYVTDGGNNCVAVFDSKGTYLSQFGEKGAAPGQLFQPVGIAVDAKGLIWVVDSGNNRLQAFKADGTSAQIVPVPDWQGEEIKEGYLYLIDKELFLTDPVGNRLWKVQGDALVALETEELLGPSGLAWDKTTLYVTQRGRNVITRIARKKG